MTDAANGLKLVFCGTPEFAVPTLEALLAAHHQIALVVSQPDRPTGRDQQLTAPAVKQAALAAGLPVTQPEKIRSNTEFRSQLESIAPDAIIVVAYGRIIPPWMLALPRLGCINLHASLLPKHRGAAPIQWAIALGDAYTGNTTMLLEEDLDTGPILLQQTVEIGPTQTAVDLFPLLARAGAPLVVETLAGLSNGSIHPQPQSHEEATFAPLLDREDGRIDFAARTAHEIYNRWRGFQPWPGAFTTLNEKKLIVHSMAIARGSYAEGLGFAEPSWVVVENHRLLVACAENTWLEFLEIQLEGKKRMTTDEFLRGNPLPADARFG
jgi:methionyl-tRNA formyltransferase